GAPEPHRAPSAALAPHEESHQRRAVPRGGIDDRLTVGRKPGARDESATEREAMKRRRASGVSGKMREVADRSRGGESGKDGDDDPVTSAITPEPKVGCGHLRRSADFGDVLAHSREVSG